MSDNDNKSSFASFMAPKKEESKNSSGTVIGPNKTKEALNTAKEDKEKEKGKELLEAKKNSAALANRYGQGDMMKLQAKNIAMLLPFIIFGVIIFLLIIFKGGAWLSKGLNSLFNIMTTGK